MEGLPVRTKPPGGGRYACYAQRRAARWRF